MKRKIGPFSGSLYESKALLQREHPHSGGGPIGWRSLAWNMLQADRSQCLQVHELPSRTRVLTPTAASNFLEALGFAYQVFTLCHMNPLAVLTSRGKGAAHSMFLQKRKLKQAPTFSGSGQSL